MSKKAFMATIIITAFLVLLVARMEAVEVARANPFGYLPPSPNKDPPTIILESLSYDGNNSDIELNFAVTIPDSWNSLGYLDRNCYVYQINCEIDNQSILTLNDAVNVNGLTKDAQYNTTNLTNLTVGQHILQINISSLSLYNPPPLPSNWLDPYCYYSTLAQKVPFSVDAESNVLLSSPLPSAVLNSYSVSHYLQNHGGYSPQPNSTETTTITVTPTLSPSLTLTPSSNPTKSTSVSPSPSTKPSPTPLPTLTVSPITTPSPSPIQTPTIEPSQTPDRPKVGDFAPVLIPASMILLAIIAVILLVYFRKRR